MVDLEAEFNRWSISKHDFDEAHEYLKTFDANTDAIVQRALLSAAIVAYGRPFKRSDGYPKADKFITLPDGFFDAASLQLHDRIISLRDRGIAHSDFDTKPTARVPIKGAGFMTWSKPFNPLSEGLNIKAFEDLSWRLSMHCWTEMSRLDNQMKGAPPPASPVVPPSEGFVTNLVIPLSEFLPKKD